MNQQTADGGYEKLRRQVMYCLMIAMMLSLFLSRATLSISLVAFVAVSFFHKNIPGHLANFIRSPLLCSMSLLFILPLLSGLWSTDKEQWLESIRIKLPLIFLPLAFAGTLNFSQRSWKLLSYFFTGLVCAATIWSMFHYVSNITEVNESYLRAKSMLTPLGNDHIRFSWLVSATVLLAVWLGIHSKNRIASWLLFAAAVWLVVFLHVLAARTGLFAFYLMAFITVIWLAIKKARPLFAFIIIIVLIALPVIAYFSLPTFHNRVSYILYDMNYFREADYMPGSNDAIRVISLKAGWNVLNENPAYGVGFGNVFSETKNWYHTNYPQMQEPDKIFPSSEWLMYGIGCGWPGLLLFTGIMLLPFFIRVQHKLPWWLLNSAAAFSFLFDIGLEVQYGVFIYAFVILYWYIFAACSPSS